MGYFRMIQYLDYYKNNEKICNGGFLKLEKKDDYIYLSLNIKCDSSYDGITVPIYFCGLQMDEEIGTLDIYDGRAVWNKKMSIIPTIQNTQLKYDELLGIRIQLKKDASIGCIWGKKEAFNVADDRKNHNDDESKNDESKNDESKNDESKNDGTIYITLEEESEMGRNDNVIRDSLKEDNIREDSLKDDNVIANSVQENPKKEVDVMGKNGKENEVKTEAADTKWQQLFTIYPHIFPFNDHREYLSLGPSDFVILNEKSYKIANNSFLLHGYYNYKHLILTRIEASGEIQYYLGVPGNFYNREKQVALMFGFESFECAEEPAQDGDFGYYMLRVQI